MACISSGDFQLLVGPASDSSALQINVPVLDTGNIVDVTAGIIAIGIFLRIEPGQCPVSDQHVIQPIDFPHPIHHTSE